MRKWVNSCPTASGLYWLPSATLQYILQSHQMDRARGKYCTSHSSSERPLPVTSWEQVWLHQSNARTSKAEETARMLPSQQGHAAHGVPGEQLSRPEDTPPLPWALSRVCPPTSNLPCSSHLTPLPTSGSRRKNRSPALTWLCHILLSPLQRKEYTGVCFFF